MSFISLLIVCNLSIWAQKKIITGRVLDTETGLSFPFTSFSFNDYRNCCVSNPECIYVMFIAADRFEDSLSFIYLGYDSFGVCIKSLFPHVSVERHRFQ